MVKSIIYGPVPSWRLGRSLGIDLLSTSGKTCSYDCVYCQLGRTVHPLVERKEFVSLDDLTLELEQATGIPVDYVTFSGMGEPTLAANLGEAIRLVRFTTKQPVAVLTNSSLITRDDVCHELSLSDVVVAKLDAPNEEMFCEINRPIIKCNFDDILASLRIFRRNYRGKLALQTMFFNTNKDYAAEIAKVAEQLSPDEVQINTPLRPCSIKPLAPNEIGNIEVAFSNFKRIVSVYKSSRPSVIPLDLNETLLRRP